jgi:hypothetical protein
MHTVDELQEMMELRKEMAKLQARYAEILDRPQQLSSEPVPVIVVKPVAAPPANPTVTLPPSTAPQPVVQTKVARPVDVPVPVAAEIKVVAPKSAPVAPPQVAPVVAAAPTPVPEVITPTPPVTAAVASAPTGGGSVRESIVAVINASGKALAFDEIYAGLEAGGYKLPAEKPKLVVRRTLFNKAVFNMVGKDKHGQGQYEVA